MDNLNMDILLTERQAAEYCGVSLSFLRRRRSKSCKLPGPSWVKLGSTTIRYQKSMLDQWIANNVKNKAE